MKRAPHNRVAKVYGQAGDNRPLLAAGKRELTESKCEHVENDAQIGLSSGEVVDKCPPLASTSATR